MIALTIILIALAAIAKAFCDTLDHHFDTSIFRYMPRKYFDPNIQHKTARQIFGYPLDGWHIGNSLMICSFMAIPLVYQPQFTWWIDYTIGGTFFVIVFNTFYNKLFR
jgi:hypothetical protein